MVRGRAAARAALVGVRARSQMGGSHPIFSRGARLEWPAHKGLTKTGGRVAAREDFVIRSRLRVGGQLAGVAEGAAGAGETGLAAASPAPAGALAFAGGWAGADAAPGAALRGAGGGRVMSPAPRM